MKQAAEPVRKGLSTDDQIKRMLKYNVEDADSNRMGHVSGLWLDAQNQAAFVGVKTSWLTGRTHIFPAQGMQVNHGREIIRAPYPEEVIKNAPTFDPGAELTEAEQQQIFDYYRQYGLQGERAMGTAGLERDTGRERRGGEREEARIALAEEELKIGKRQVEAGGLRLRKIVHTEPVRQEVELTREEIEIERVPAGEGRAGTAESSFKGEDIFIPLRREEPVVQKEARVREEVRVGKKARTERETVSDTVRKEELETSGTRSGEEESTRMREEELERERERGRD